MNLIEKFHHWRRRMRWNRQYRKGRWENLKSEVESHRYFKIIHFIKKYGTINPNILDLGCGDGVLLQRLGNFHFNLFFGIDFSSVSINYAINNNNTNNTKFKSIDILKFKPDRKYDVIIFNEVFYYIPDTEKNRIIDLMIKHLNEKGIIISSIFREGIGCWEYFKENLKLKEEAFDLVTTKNKNTYWKIGVYRKY